MNWTKQEAHELAERWDLSLDELMSGGEFALNRISQSWCMVALKKATERIDELEHQIEQKAPVREQIIKSLRRLDDDEWVSAQQITRMVSAQSSVVRLRMAELWRFGTVQRKRYKHNGRKFVYRLTPE